MAVGALVGSVVSPITVLVPRRLAPPPVDRLRTGAPRPLPSSQPS
ncbi:MULTISPECIES: hypothetical protein [Streptomyces]